MRFNIVGYESLISHESLRETVSDRKFRPVLVRGYKRIFKEEISNGKGWNKPIFTNKKNKLPKKLED